MLLDFITFSWETGDGAISVSGEHYLAATRAQLPQIGCRNSSEIAEGELVAGKFGKGNDKLGKGEGLLTFDMPPIATCPGSRYAICRELRPDCKEGMEPVCWARRKRYRQPKLQTPREVNYRFSQSNAFVPWANGVISRSRTAKAVRLPGTGDMYNVEFVRKVRAIIQANPKIKFWFYTRCWAVPNIWKELETLKAEPNLTMWLSWDAKMAEYHGTPPDRDLPWCWLAMDDSDLPPEPVDLVWRFDGKASGKPTLGKRYTLGGCLVCPHENGVTKTTCAACGICWKGKKFRKAKTAKLLDKYKE